MLARYRDNTAEASARSVMTTHQRPAIAFPLERTAETSPNVTAIERKSILHFHCAISGVLSSAQVNAPSWYAR
jgi:hypothetical protein